MAYYVYKVFASRQLEYVDVRDAYREARLRTRELRKTLAPDADYAVRMVFAPTREEAERLLRQVREARPLGEDA